MLSLSITTHAAEKDETITLTDSKKIAYARALNEAIDQVSKKVAECVEKKLAAPEKCFCLPQWSPQRRPFVVTSKPAI